MPLEIGATYRTRTVGEALVTGVCHWPLRNGTVLELFEGVLMRDGRPVRWESDGTFAGSLGNDPYDLILT